MLALRLHYLNLRRPAEVHVSTSQLDGLIVVNPFTFLFTSVFPGKYETAGLGVYSNLDKLNSNLDKLEGSITGSPEALREEGA